MVRHYSVTATPRKVTRSGVNQKMQPQEHEKALPPKRKVSKKPSSPPKPAQSRRTRKVKKCGFCGFETLETNFKRHFSSAHGIRTPKLMIEAQDASEVLMPTFAELPDLDNLEGL